MSAVKGEASLSSSSMSVRDILRQRYSVTWHPRLLYLIVSDGYMATVMRVLGRPSPALFLKSLLTDVSKDLEKASCKLDKSQVNYCVGIFYRFFFLGCIVYSPAVFSDSCEGLVGVCILLESGQQP